MHPGQVQCLPAYLGGILLSDVRPKIPMVRSCHRPEHPISDSNHFLMLNDFHAVSRPAGRSRVSFLLTAAA